MEKQNIGKTKSGTGKIPPPMHTQAKVWRNVSYRSF